MRQSARVLSSRNPEEVRRDEITEIVANGENDFFMRVRSLVEFLIEKPSRLSFVVELARKHLHNGSAGKALLGQLRQIKEGSASLEKLQMAWLR